MNLCLIQEMFKMLAFVGKVMEKLLFELLPHILKRFWSDPLTVFQRSSPMIRNILKIGSMHYCLQIMEKSKTNKSSDLTGLQIIASFLPKYLTMPILYRFCIMCPRVEKIGCLNLATNFYLVHFFFRFLKIDRQIIAKKDFSKSISYASLIELLQVIIAHQGPLSS